MRRKDKSPHRLNLKMIKSVYEIYENDAKKLTVFHGKLWSNDWKGIPHRVQIVKKKYYRKSDFRKTLYF